MIFPEFNPVKPRGLCVCAHARACVDLLAGIIFLSSFA
jgi:hypothetical protein